MFKLGGHTIQTSDLLPNEPSVDDFFIKELSPRVVGFLEMRDQGMTLEGIGHDFGQTRERVRQVVKSASTKIQSGLPQTMAKVELFLKDKRVAPESELIELLGQPSHRFISAALGVFGFNKFQIGSSASIYWCHTNYNLVKEFDAFALKQAPLILSDFLSHAVPLFSNEELVRELILNSRKVSLQGSICVVRRSAKDRDLVYLLLLKAGSSIHIQNLAKEVGISVRALAAQLMRDNRFYRAIPSNLWGLVEWKPESVVESVYDAVDQILSTHGPQNTTNLIRLASQLYPRSAARYVQILEAEKYGLNADGDWDFTSNGARQKLAKEPPKNPKVEESSNGFARIIIPVDSELLRGSGVPVNRRLTWIMNLKQPTRELVFEDKIIAGKEITVYRTPGSHHMSALKAHAELFQLKDGCELEVVFDTTAYKVGIRPCCTCHAALFTN